MHAVGAADGKCLQVQVQGWVSTCGVMGVQTGSLEFRCSGE